MISAEDIKGTISKAVACELVEVQGDGQHWEAVIVSREFEGRNTVQQHQIVYRALGDRMKEEIHALSMKTMTPAQWNQR